MKLKLFFTLFCAAAHAFSFKPGPVDVVIPAIEKDLATLDLCIAGIKKNCPEVRRVIVVSAKRLTSHAEWFDEARYPFTKNGVARHLFHSHASTPSLHRVGWYYQQLLKLYAPFVIPGISENVLILDSDTIFLNPVTFLSKEGAGLYNPGSEYHEPYFAHMERFLPGLTRLLPEYSGISHHMLMQRPVLEALFDEVEAYHGRPLWQAFCRCVDPKEYPLSGASEYEIYFNYVFSVSDQVQIRFLQWANVWDLKSLSRYQTEGYHYISNHSWMR